MPRASSSQSLSENEPRLHERDRGSDHLVSLLQAIDGSSCANDTMVVVTYSTSSVASGTTSTSWSRRGAPGIHDQWGPVVDVSPPW